MRYSNEHKAETRHRVLKEAAREIRAKGPGGVAVAGVMARAGLTHGGFYAHFASKDELVAEAVGTMFDDAGRVAGKIGHVDEPRRWLRAYLDFYLSPAHRDNRERGCPLPSLSGDLAREQGAARDRFGLGVASLSGRIAGALRALGCADPETDGTAVLAQLVGAVALARAVADPAQSDAILAAAHANLVARFGLDLAH